MVCGTTARGNLSTAWLRPFGFEIPNPVGGGSLSGSIPSVQRHLGDQFQGQGRVVRKLHGSFRMFPAVQPMFECRDSCARGVKPNVPFVGSDVHQNRPLGAFSKGRHAVGDASNQFRRPFPNGRLNRLPNVGQTLLKVVRKARPVGIVVGVIRQNQCVSPKDKRLQGFQ